MTSPSSKSVSRSFYFGGLSFFLELSSYEQLAMIISLIVVLIVYLLNSAIECVVDRAGTEHDVLSGIAKDYGALAVLLSILIAVVI
jgi:diacylglycerol kinase (ATP)